ncbi:MAG: DUF427 domain-containing protein [Ardenticatenaceae bacterium]
MKSKIPEWLRLAQSKWTYRGQERPAFALEPGVGEDSVWDYPRPPALQADTRRVVVKVGARLIADSTNTIRVLETASPPTIYIPPADIDFSLLAEASGSSMCEWKGPARYFRLAGQKRGRDVVGWSYPKPFAGFEAIADYLSFYPAKLECYIDNQRVRPQPGGFYGGWVTSEIIGPFKGEPGTGGW